MGIPIPVIWPLDMDASDFSMQIPMIFFFLIPFEKFTTAKLFLLNVWKTEKSALYEKKYIAEHRWLPLAFNCLPHKLMAIFNHIILTFQFAT